MTVSNVDHLLGLTPLMKRIAFAYLLKGEGTHASMHPAYDKVVVRSLYDWKTPQDPALPSQGGVVVEFWNDGKRIRWIDFGCRVVGGGGETVVREV